MKFSPAVLTLVLAMTAAEGRRYRGGRGVLTPSFSWDKEDLEASFDLVSEILSSRSSPMNNLANQLWKTTSDNNLFDMPTMMTSPRYAVAQQGDVITLRMELPGVAASDLDVSLENDRLLRIQGKRQMLAPAANDHHDSVMEFDQSFQLDKEVDPNSIKVTLQNGILQVTGSKKTKTVKRLQIQEAAENNAEESVKKLSTEPAEPQNPDDLVITEEE